MQAGIALGAAAGMGMGLQGIAQAQEASNASDSDSEVLEFLKSLDYDDGLATTVAILKRFPMQYGTTLGLDGAPQIRPLEFKFEQDGALYFDTVDFYESYREMRAFPQLQICIGDQATMFYLRVGGTVQFTRDEDVIERCFEASPVLTSQFGDNREHVVGYYLIDAWAEFSTFTEGLPSKRWDLPNNFDE